MAHEIKLDVYTLQIKRQKKDEFIGFDEFYKKQDTEYSNSDSKDFKEFFIDYIKSFDSKFWVQAITGKAISLSKDHIHFNSKENIIYGLIEGGTTGLGFKIKNKEDISDENAFVVTTEMVESIPYYFMIWLPNDSNRGLLIVQSFGTKSISETFRIHLRRFFNNNTKSLVLVTGDLIPKDTATKMEEKGFINTITLRRMHLPTSKAEKLLGIKYMEDKNLTIEIKISGLSKIKKIRDRIRQNAQGIYTNIIDTTHIEDIGFDKDYDVIAKFEHNGKTAIGKLSQNFKLAPSYYINEEDIKRNIYQHPEFESINNYCISFLETLKKDIGYKKTK